MVTEQHETRPHEPEYPQDLPPVTELAIGTMILVIVGGTYIAGHIPDEVPLLLPTVLAVAAGVLLAANIYLLTTIKRFAWDKFRLVFGWSLAGYGVIAGLLAFVFIRDDIPNDVMAFLAAMLIMFAVNIPLLFGFSVARYQPVPDRDAE